jgi:hypothetical protein
VHSNLRMKLGLLSASEDLSGAADVLLLLELQEMV